MIEVLAGLGLALAAWLLLEPVLFRVLPRLERVLPSDVIGPDGWFADTSNQSGIFDLPLKRRQG
ncbi:MAG: hypothetical protein ACSHXH_13485 [Marivita sp.]|uniref:hypothetical protein n=1 Tax=Marivita sp. TaxID=2003365 RepID=UPI003EF6A174